jgi:hypothetical protein
VTGATGPTGASSAFDYAEFYALMPSDNSATVQPGAAVEFPNEELSNGPISSSSPWTTFTLGTAGIYRVTFQVSVDEPGQLELSVNGVAQPYTVVGRATGTSEIVGDSLVTATAGATIAVINPSANSTALTITPNAGGTQPVSATIVIQQIG